MLLELDSQKRLSLGKLLKGINAKLFNVEVVGGKIVIEPMQAVPHKEAWLHQNPQALKGVRDGLTDAKKGNISEFDPDKE